MDADAASQCTKLCFVPGAYQLGGLHAATIGGDKASAVYMAENSGVQKWNHPPMAVPTTT